TGTLTFSRSFWNSPETRSTTLPRLTLSSFLVLDLPHLGCLALDFAPSVTVNVPPPAGTEASTSTLPTFLSNHAGTSLPSGPSTANFSPTVASSAITRTAVACAEGLSILNFSASSPSATSSEGSSNRTSRDVRNRITSPPGERL